MGLMSGRRPAGERAWTALPEANWSEFRQVPSVFSAWSSPYLLMSLTGSTVPGFSPRNSKLPVFVLGLFLSIAQSHVLGNPVLLSRSDCKIGF